MFYYWHIVYDSTDHKYKHFGKKKNVTAVAKNRSRLFSLIFPKEFCVKYVDCIQFIFVWNMVNLYLFSAFAKMEMFFRKEDCWSEVLGFEIFWNCLWEIENLLVEGDGVGVFDNSTLWRDKRFLSIYIVLRDCGWGTGWGFMRWLVSSF